MTYIPVAVRREVIDRANRCCEYCRISERERDFPFAIDHIIAEKHGGRTVSDNLCFSCFWCNSHKGSDISSIDWQNDEQLSWLFNPRTQNWNDHFRLGDGRIVGLTPEGRVTVFLFQLNVPTLVLERQLLVMRGLYPC
jgi:hypothetical protein